LATLFVAFNKLRLSEIGSVGFLPTPAHGELVKAQA
jgi:hypothetical protein